MNQLLFTEIIPKEFWIYPGSVSDADHRRLTRSIEDHGGIVVKRLTEGCMKLGRHGHIYPASLKPIHSVEIIDQMVGRNKWITTQPYRLRTLLENDPENVALEAQLEEQLRCQHGRSVHFLEDVQLRTIRRGGHICDGVIPGMIRGDNAGAVRGRGRLRISPHRPVIFNQGIQFPDLERETTRPPRLSDGSFVRAWQVDDRIAFLTNWEQEPLTLGQRAIPQWEHWERDQMLLYIYNNGYFTNKKGRAFWEKARSENIHLVHRSQDALKHQWGSKSMRELIQEKITGRLKKKFLADPLLKEHLPHNFVFRNPGDEEDDHYQT